MLNRNLSVMKDHNELIKELKEIKHKIKIYEAHADSIKKQLITHHFENTDTLYCPDGLIASTYKSSVRISFQTEKFKKEHSELYNQYLDAKEIHTLLIK